MTPVADFLDWPQSKNGRASSATKFSAIVNLKVEMVPGYIYRKCP